MTREETIVPVAIPFLSLFATGSSDGSDGAKATTENISYSGVLFRPGKSG